MPPSKADVERWADEAAISQSYAEDSRRVVAMADMLTRAMRVVSAAQHAKDGAIWCDWCGVVSPNHEGGCTREALRREWREEVRDG